MALGIRVGTSTAIEGNRAQLKAYKCISDRSSLGYIENKFVPVVACFCLEL